MVRICRINGLTGLLTGTELIEVFHKRLAIVFFLDFFVLRICPKNCYAITPFIISKNYTLLIIAL